MNKIKMFIPFLFTVFIIFIFHITHLQGLKIYPCCVNFSIFLIFFISIFQKETVIQKIARSMEGGALSPNAIIYTKNLTYMWIIFLFFQFLISVLTCFLSDAVWMVYNGLISYFLLFLFFLIEYCVRLKFKKRWDEA